MALFGSSFDAPVGKGIDKPYKIRGLSSSEWSETKHRMLIVLQTVDSEDLRAQRLLASEVGRSVLDNVIRQSKVIVRRYQELYPKRPSDLIDTPFAHALINFNAAKTFHLPHKEQESANKIFANRIIEVIKRKKPTHVLISGERAAQALLTGHLSYPIHYDHGVVHRVTFGSHTCKVVTTFDLEKVYNPRSGKDLELEDDEDLEEGDTPINNSSDNKFNLANLLGFVFRHTANLYHGQTMFSIQDIVPRGKLITTLAKFDALMDRLEKTDKPIAVDTETSNLNVWNNPLYTVQFATDTDVGYIVPVLHPKTPFKSKEIEHIKKRLRKFFGSASQSKTPYFLFCNAPFDLRILRVNLNIARIPKMVYDTIAGETLIDENIKEVTTYYKAAGLGKQSVQGLAPQCHRYGNNSYANMTFSKGDRELIGAKDFTEDVIEYMGMDVQSLIGLSKQQMAQADMQFIAKKSYGQYFINMMLHQMSPTCHNLSHMKQNGSHIDLMYLATLKSTDSPLVAQIRQVKKEFYKFDSVRALNRQLLKEKGIGSNKGLFGGGSGSIPYLFDPNKPEHKQRLFFEKMGLKPLAFGKPVKGKPGKGKVDKAFQMRYKNEHPEVATFQTLSKLGKLFSSYVKGWYKRIKESSDSKNDHRLRPDYGYKDVVTGRLNSSGPSLQQIPNRGSLAHIIKRMFISRAGYLTIKFDYSAHEIRVWSYVSLDQVIADTFKVGQKLRQIFMVKPTEDNLKAVKIKGDFHLLNIKRFFGLDVDKKHPLRESVKTTVFGKIYGQSDKTTAKTQYEVALGMARESIAKIKDALVARATPELTRASKEAKASIDTLQKAGVTPFLKTSEDVSAKLFKEFDKGAKWLERVSARCEVQGISYAPHGRIRHLYGVFTGLKQAVAACARRAKNSPVQGLASDIGMVAAHMIGEQYYQYLRKNNLLPEDLTQRLGYPIRAVHDALYFEIPYEHVLPFTHICQWVATYGVTEYYKEKFGIEFTVEPEIEMAFMAREDHEDAGKWDWSFFNLRQVLTKAVEDKKEIGLLDKKETVDSVLEKIYAPYESKKVLAYLEEFYPMLGVKNLSEKVGGVNNLINPKSLMPKEKAK